MNCAAPRRLRARGVPPWRSEWLTTHHLGKALRRATGAALSARGRTDGVGLCVLDLGCGQRPWAGLFGRAWCIGVDVDTWGARPDVIATATALPFAAHRFDLVFCSQVLEHVPAPQPVLAECVRVLRPGGELLLSVPFYWPLHEEPHDYRRFTARGLELDLEEAGFDLVKLEADCGSLTMVVAAVLELLPRRHGLWLPMAPLVLLANGLALILQGLSRDRRSTLNWVVRARRRAAGSPAASLETS
jgi:SAM-dependent methyltransferase